MWVYVVDCSLSFCHNYFFPFFQYVDRHDSCVSVFQVLSHSWYSRSLLKMSVNFPLTYQLCSHFVTFGVDSLWLISFFHLFFTAFSSHCLTVIVLYSAACPSMPPNLRALPCDVSRERCDVVYL